MLEHLTDEEKNALNEIKQSVSNLVGERLQGLYLFGSKARGDYDPESDVDIAIIVDNLDRELRRKVIDIVVEIETKYIVVFSSLVLSSEEYDDLLNRERRIALDIKQEGIPV